MTSSSILPIYAQEDSVYAEEMNIQESKAHGSSTGAVHQAHDLRYYISRPQEEKKAQEYFDMVGAPAVFWGPQLFGKTRLLQHLFANRADSTDQKEGVPSKNQKNSKTVFVNFHDLLNKASHFPNAVSSPQDLLSNFVTCFAWAIAQELGSASSKVLAHLERSGSPTTNSTYLMERYVLPSIDGLFYVVVERADAIFGYSFQDVIFLMLRRWLENSRSNWLRLRLCLTIRVNPTYLILDTAGSPFNLVPHVRVEEFALGQLQQLKERFALRDDDTAIEEMFSFIGGHPYLTFEVMRQASVTGQPIPQVLQETMQPDGLFHQHLRQHVLWLQERPRLYQAVRIAAHDSSYVMNPVDFYELYGSGLAVFAEENAPHGQGILFRLRSRLYQDYMRRHLA